MRKALRGIVLGAAGLGFAVPAAAAITWDFTSGLTEAGTNSGTFGNTRYETDGGVKVTASAWSNTVNSTNTKIESAYLGLYTGGLGVTNRDGASGGGDTNEGTPTNTISPEHAVDNNDRYDAILLHFDQAVNLSSVSIGFKDTDADITVLASNGATLLGNTYGGATGLVAAGWSLIGNYADLTTSAAKSIANSLYKTDWLILAYNPDFGSGANLGSGNDYFKVSVVTGNLYKPPPPGNAPEPGTAFLLGAAMIGGLWNRRRSKRG